MGRFLASDCRIEICQIAEQRSLPHLRILYTGVGPGRNSRVPRLRNLPIDNRLSFT
jgi:hypothetical protein